MLCLVRGAFIRISLKPHCKFVATKEVTINRRKTGPDYAIPETRPVKQGFAALLAPHAPLCRIGRAETPCCAGAGIMVGTGLDNLCDDRGRISSGIGPESRAGATILMMFQMKGCKAVRGLAAVAGANLAVAFLSAGAAFAQPYR